MKETKHASIGSSRGMTLVELLVTMGILSLLTGLLMPALGRVRQVAYRIECGANLRSIGLALHGYEQDLDRLPPQYDRWGPVAQTYDNQYLEPWISYVAFHQDEQDEEGRMLPLQLAYLIEQHTLADPEVLYCPGQPLSGDHAPFTYAYYTDQGNQTWGEFLPIKANGQADDKIRSSYHYWLHDRRRLSRLSRQPVLLDNIQHWNSVAHHARGRPRGVNAWFGDGHVAFQSQDALFEPDLWNGGAQAGPWDGPGNDPNLFMALLDQMSP